MKASVKGIRIQEMKSQQGGGGAPPPPGSGAGTPFPPPPGKPENVDEWGEDEKQKNRDKNGKPEEGSGEGEFQQSDEPGGGSGEGSGKGSGTNPGGVLRPGELGDLGGDDGIKGKSSDQLADEWETALKRSTAAGNAPASVKRALERLRAPVIDWKAELEKYIDDAVSKTKYKLPARRFIGGGQAQYGYKRYKEDFESIVIAIDTSGSITRSMIEQFLSETMKITDVYNPQKTVILYCDTQVYEPDILEPGDSPNFDKIAGGGGTNFWPPFKWVQKNMIENGEVPTVFIYFTDGFATFPSNLDYDIDTYEDRCIWVFLSFDGKPFGDDQPFGERIDITLANKNIKTI